MRLKNLINFPVFLTHIILFLILTYYGKLNVQQTFYFYQLKEFFLIYSFSLIIAFGLVYYLKTLSQITIGKFIKLLINLILLITINFISFKTNYAIMSYFTYYLIYIQHYTFFLFVETQFFCYGIYFLIYLSIMGSFLLDLVTLLNLTNNEKLVNIYILLILISFSILFFTSFIS